MFSTIEELDYSSKSYIIFNDKKIANSDINNLQKRKHFPIWFFLLTIIMSFFFHMFSFTEGQEKNKIIKKHTLDDSITFTITKQYQNLYKQKYFNQLLLKLNFIHFKI